MKQKPGVNKSQKRTRVNVVDYFRELLSPEKSSLQTESHSFIYSIK